jgi:Zn-dependent protease with chaperone function
MSVPSLPRSPLYIEKHIYPKEKIYYNIMFTVSVLVWLALFYIFISALFEGGSILLIYIVVFSLVTWFSHGLGIAYLRSNALKLSTNQHGELYHFVKELASTQFNIHSQFDVFIIESGGLLNAFFTRFLGRNFIVLYSDVVKLADEGGEEALGFIVAHELAHFKLNHLSFWKTFFLIPSMLIPFLSPAYYRSKEYTCDKIAHAVFPEGAGHGLLALMAGASNYKHSNLDAVTKQFYEEKGFWSWLAEIGSTHPHLMCRIQALSRLQYL